MWDIYRSSPRPTTSNHLQLASAFAMVGIVWFAGWSFPASRGLPPRV